MAKEIKWESLTPEEAQLLADLKNRGVEIFAAPIEIEENEESRKNQFASLGITWEQVRTWYIGSEPVKVHLFPADEATYKMLLNDLRAKHRSEYRHRRCLIPGTQKPLILCPDCYKCSACPFPEYREKHEANILSWDEYLESGLEEAYYEPEFSRADIMDQLDAVCDVIKAKNPKYLEAIVLKEYHGLSVDEIAERMHETKRNVYFFISEAKKIGKQYRKTKE